MKVSVVTNRWHPLLKALPVTLLAIAALGTAGSPLGIWSSHIERMSHFRFWWIALLVVLAGWFLRKQWRAFAAIATALIAWAAVPLAPYWISSPTTAANGKGLKFLAWNLFWENPTKELAGPWLAEQDADVILLTEYTNEWRERLLPLREKYRHEISSGRDGAEGMLLLSRFPLDSPDPDGLAASKPWISTTLLSPSGPVRIIGMHPRTPRSGSRFDQRNEQYDHVARLTEKAGMPAVAGRLELHALFPVVPALPETRKTTRFRPRIRPSFDVA